jgi:GalNAc-alpha-(1->4)-GalNAc-alpha-(1->3)-diNAcBac-PP-undecaprenol alpha-1,4-N-acetyl-D-galactosaminyltransferase
MPAWQQRLIRWHYPKAERIIAQTEAVRSHCHDVWGIPTDRCAVIANPIEAAWLDAPADFATRQRNLVIAIGRLEVVKSFDTLIRACAALPRSELIILGDGEERQRLQALVGALGVGNRISLPGACPDPRPYLDRAGAFALTSRFEGFPNALAEAMARGCPIVSTDCPTGPREMIRDGDSGMLVPVGNVIALTNSLNRLASDDALARRLGAAAHAVATAWHIDRIAPLWLEG